VIRIEVKQWVEESRSICSWERSDSVELLQKNRGREKVKRLFSKLDKNQDGGKKQSSVWKRVSECVRLFEVNLSQAKK
jgi:hypothetical protein